MEEIQHKHVQVGTLKLHIAELGSGSKVVLFLHGFPEIWYSWRHQMVGVAKAGYRAIAMDFRGYGLSDHSPEPEKSNFTDFAEDVIGLLDALGIHKVFLVGKDFAPIVMSIIAVLHPERLHGFITMGGAFILPGIGNFEEHTLPKGFYIPRWQEPGRAEADFGRFDVKTVIRNIYIMFCSSELQIARDDQEIMDLVPPNTPLPPWISDKDLDVYADLYQNSGFHTALQVPYRNVNVAVAVENPIVKVPALLIMGEKDYVLKFPGMEDYIRGGMINKFVPDQEIVFIPDGTHFVQEQFPENINQLLVSFLDYQTIQET